ncbi:hypothetical protein PENSPDRAFT_648575 [Peniophora sp. CONT]|nr:hypothetical protein PENSPDRAFT_648575 [Peniophora sp. CONT]
MRIAELSPDVRSRSGIVPLTAEVRGRITRVAVLLVFYIMIVIHWALSVKYASDLLIGVWLGLPLGYINGSDVGLLYYNFGPIIPECLLFGMFCTLSVVSVYVFTHRNWRTRSHQVMLAVSLLMFTISLVHLALQMLLIAAAFRPFIGLTPQFDNVGLVYMPIMLVTINVILGDGIVLWRMSALCQHDARARFLAAILFAPTFTVGIANLAQEFAGGDIGADVAPGVASLSDFTYGTAVLALSLATNLISTLVIAGKAWLYRKSLAEDWASFSRHSIVEKVMSLLIESGTIYCIIWALYIVDSKSSVFELSRDTLTQSAAVISGLHFTGGAAYFSRLMAQVTGIYPTIILVIVALQQDHVDNALNESKLSSFVAARVPSTERTRSTLSLGLGGAAATQTDDAHAAVLSAQVDIEAEGSRALPPNKKRPIRETTLRDAPTEIAEIQSLHSTRSEPMQASYYPARIRQHITMPTAMPHRPRPVRLSSPLSSSSHSSPTVGSAFMSSSQGISPRSSSATSTNTSFVGSAQLLRDTGRQDGFGVLPPGSESQRTSIVDEVV